jgi:hypothetical protein
MGLELAVPDHTTLSRRARTWRSAGREVRRKIPTKEAIHILVDSTGLEVYGAGQWLEEKHGAKSRRGWRKLHLALDADSGDIIAHVMTGQHMGDSSQVGALLDQIDGPIGKFTADGAYDGDPTYDAVSRHSADAAVIIPPRANGINRSGTGIDSQRRDAARSVRQPSRSCPCVVGGLLTHVDLSHISTRAISASCEARRCC